MIKVHLCGMKFFCHIFFMMTLMLLFCTVGCKEKEEDNPKNQEISTQQTSTPTLKSTPNPTIAPRITSGFYEYQECEGGISIIKYNDKEKNLKIPESIDDKKVIAISQYAFAENEFLEEVVIPKTVEIIAANSFRSCKNLNSVEILSNNTTLIDTAFSECRAIKTFKKSEDIKTILFIGNSLTSNGAIPNQVGDILKKEGNPYNVFKVIMLGRTIADIWDDRENNDLEFLLKISDIVVMQAIFAIHEEPEEKHNEINSILEISKEGAKHYAIVTEFENYSYLKRELADYDITLINTGKMFQELIANNKFKRSQLIMEEDDLHPTMLYGYFSAMMIYKTIFGKNVCDIEGIDFLSQRDEIEIYLKDISSKVAEDNLRFGRKLIDNMK